MALRFARFAALAPKQSLPTPHHDRWWTGGGAHLALIRGARCFRMTVWSHVAQTQCNGKSRVGVSLSTHSLPHLTAAASQPLHWPGVACGSYSGRVLLVSWTHGSPVSSVVQASRSGLHQVHAGLSPGNRPYHVA